MADLCIEILSEEIPGRMQKDAENRFHLTVLHSLEEAGLGGELKQFWSGPRRIAVSIAGVAEWEADINEERRGPRADAPEEAIEGFLKSAGISRDQAEIRKTDKGEFLFAVIDRKGRPATEVLPGMMSSIITGFAWPKTMRWESSQKGWVRPIHRITVLFDGKPLTGHVDLGGGMKIAFGDVTHGHRILAPGPIKLSEAKGYEEVLREAFVIAGRDERRKMITSGLVSLAKEQKVTLRDDEALLEEVTGLIEYPHVIMGEIDAAFMSLPEEILITAMRGHQKYFAFEDGKGNLAPLFATVSNMTPDAARDAVIRTGNERVLRARLADAGFFWEQDCNSGIDKMAKNLGGILFFERLGTMQQKAGRLAGLAEMITKRAGGDAKMAHEAGTLAKADLVSHTVGEFPEVQGVTGGHLARHDGEDTDIHEAITEHYRPQGPHDAIPATYLGRIIALADKIDTLLGFFAIGNAPTGSRDPYALRRAALGVIRIIVEGGIDLPLLPVFEQAAKGYQKSKVNIKTPPQTLMPFFHERLKVWLRERGIRHDVVTAVIREGDRRNDDLLHLYRLAETLSSLIDNKEGKALLAGYKRASNILAAEEKKDGKRFSSRVNKKLLTEKAEKGLFDQVEKMLITEKITDTDAAIKRMKSLADLRDPIDDFFEKVTVNDDNKAVRKNRLALLALVRETMEEIADFSAIEG